MGKKKREQDADPKESVAFEDALAEVEEVVERLESGELGLSDSLEEYERGIKKVKQCHQALEQAERRISVLTSVDEDGTANVEPVDTGIQNSRSPSSAGEAGGKPAKKRVRKKTPPPPKNVDENEGLF